MTPVRSPRPVRQWFATTPRRETPDGKKTALVPVRAGRPVTITLGKGDSAEVTEGVRFVGTGRITRGKEVSMRYDMTPPTGMVSFMSVTVKGETVTYKCIG